MKKDEEVQVREVARIPGSSSHVADAEHMDQRTDARDDHHHDQRELIELDVRLRP